MAVFVLGCFFFFFQEEEGAESNSFVQNNLSWPFQSSLKGSDRVQPQDCTGRSLPSSKS